MVGTFIINLRNNLEEAIKQAKMNSKINGNWIIYLNKEGIIEDLEDSISEMEME